LYFLLKVFFFGGGGGGGVQVCSVVLEEQKQNRNDQSYPLFMVENSVINYKAKQIARSCDVLTFLSTFRKLYWFHNFC